MAKQVPLPSDLDSVLSAVVSEAAEEEEEEEETETDIFPVSDDKYAHYLQLQEVLIGSAIINFSKASMSSSPPSMAMINAIGSTSDKGLEEVFKEPETAESSQPFCEICAERKENDQMFKIQSCLHSFCSDCVSKHAETKIRGSSSITVVTCPGIDCKAVLELDTCRPVLPKPVVDLWEELLCQELINSTWQRFYCPFENCSAMLVYDNADCDCDGKTEDNGSVIRESECPFCHGLFCARCNVPWHAGVGCEEFQRLDEDERGREDIMLFELARDQKWSRCPQCRFYVERTDGCPHIVCRNVKSYFDHDVHLFEMHIKCGFEFCYGCESQWTSSHGGCSRN